MDSYLELLTPDCTITGYYLFHRYFIETSPTNVCGVFCNIGTVLWYFAKSLRYCSKEFAVVSCAWVRGIILCINIPPQKFTVLSAKVGGIFTIVFVGSSIKVGSIFHKSLRNLSQNLHIFLRFLYIF